MQRHPFQNLHNRLHENSNNPSARPVIYTALGDSFTQGAFGHNEFNQTYTYHERLREKVILRHPHSVFNVINAGVGGETMILSRSRWDRDILSFKPDLITICFGLNDCSSGIEGLPSFRDTYEEFIHRVRKESGADLLMMTAPMMMKHRNPYIANVHQELIPAFERVYKEGYLHLYNKEVRKLATENSIPLFDVYRMWEDMERAHIDIHTRLSNGINHPDPAFHEELAAKLDKFIFE